MKYYNPKLPIKYNNIILSNKVMALLLLSDVYYLPTKDAIFTSHSCFIYFIEIEFFLLYFT